ncbi:MAG: hypothetical protein E7L36_00490 [Prevotella bivia]|nr:hypothetical protein [Prevotella bivia]
MEEKESKSVAQGCENVEVLQNEIKELSKELEQQKTLVEAYRKEAELYRSWWHNETTKVKGMKEDIEDVQKLTKKLLERW